MQVGNICATIMIRIEIKSFVRETGEIPFQEWFESLSAIAAAKVTTALTRLELGNISNVKRLKGGVFEYKIHWGPGVRIYFGQDGEELIILLGGGTKQRQSKDIECAVKLWKEYLNYR